MTWPSSAPSSRTSRASGSRARAEPMPAGSAARPRIARDGAPALMPAHAARRDRSATERPRAPQPFAGRNLSYPCMVMSVAARSTVAQRADGRPGPTTADAPAADRADQLDQLRFLHEVARLATTARTWDELLETVVDGTRDALHADVSSLYLLDRDGAYLTLAATNGLDRFQIGRARVPFGEGVTGHVAATPAAAGHPRRQGRPALPVGPRHRPAPVRRPRC